MTGPEEAAFRKADDERSEAYQVLYRGLLACEWQMGPGKPGPQLQEIYKIILAYSKRLAEIERVLHPSRSVREIVNACIDRVLHVCRTMPMKRLVVSNLIDSVFFNNDLRQTLTTVVNEFKEVQPNSIKPESIKPETNLHSQATPHAVHEHGSPEVGMLSRSTSDDFQPEIPQSTGVIPVWAADLGTTQGRKAARNGWKAHWSTPERKCTNEDLTETAFRQKDSPFLNQWENGKLRVKDPDRSDRVGAIERVLRENTPPRWHPSLNR